MYIHIFPPFNTKVFILTALYFASFHSTVDLGDSLYQYLVSFPILPAHWDFIAAYATVYSRSLLLIGSWMVSKLLP